MQAVVIVGAGQAGGWAAKTLRDQKFEGRIVLVGEEGYPPYERPPLSKGMLLGSCGVADTYLWPLDKLADSRIDFLQGCRAVAIRREEKSIMLSSGATLEYDRLMIATGSRVRRLDVEGADLSRVHYMRGIDDALAIERSLASGSRLLVVGGGWIGLEIAAAARQRNVDVTLVETSDQLCSRALPAVVANFLQRNHEHNGVRILLNTGVVALGGTEHFEFAVLSNGERIEADCAVIGVGVIPNSEIASEAGLEVDNGIIVDEFCRTSDDSIFAAGDVANQPDGAGGRVRIESWSNAQNQGIAAAKGVLGLNSRYQDIPYFWSDQYDTKLQILGAFKRHDDICVRSGDDGSFISFYLHDQKITAVVGVNCPQDVAAARRIMQKGMLVDPQRLLGVDNLSDVLRNAAARPVR